MPTNYDGKFNKIEWIRTLPAIPDFIENKNIKDINVDKLRELLNSWQE